MSKKCIYCREEIPDEFVVDFCARCGKNVWGEKMYSTIIKNMEEAREKGDLCHSRSIEYQDPLLLPIVGIGKKSIKD